MALRRQGWRGRGIIALCVSALGLGGGLLAASAGAATSPTTTALDRALATARQKEKAPGAQAAVVTCGLLSWAGASGVTDLSSKRSVTNSTPFVIASTTKSVTATMIMQLVQNRRLSLDARLARYYPDLPNAGKITVRMLLRNRSGLEKYEDVPAIEKLMEQRRRKWDRSDITDEITESVFPPGSEHEYVNTNWIVLGGILQQVTGKPIQVYFKRNIATRAGMTSSTWIRTSKLVNEMAHGYEQETSGGPPGKSLWINRFGPATSVFGPVFTDGGLVSTASDLAHFGNAVFDRRPRSLVSPAVLKQIIQIPANNEGYGLGIFVRNFDGHRWLGHNGSYGGYESELFTDQKRHVTIAVITNMEAATEEDAVAEPIWKSVVKAYDKQGPQAVPVCRA